MIDDEPLADHSLPVSLKLNRNLGVAITTGVNPIVENDKVPASQQAQSKPRTPHHARNTDVKSLAFERSIDAKDHNM